MRPERTPFVAAHLSSAHRIPCDGMSVEAARMAHLDYALRTALMVRLDGHSLSQRPACRRQTLFLEFGVRDGRSIGHLANHTAEQHNMLPIVWDGFDSFQDIAHSCGYSQGSETQIALDRL